MALTRHQWDELASVNDPKGGTYEDYLASIGEPEPVMTMDEFMSKMEAAFPGAAVEEHPSGELVIYTGLRADNDSVMLWTD